MNHIFRLISNSEAIAQYRLDEHIYDSKETFHAILPADTYFYLHEGDLEISGHFILDADTMEKTEDGKSIEGYIITGNLSVQGNIINENGDYGPLLYVTGNVSCTNLLIGGSPVHITGNITVTELIMLHYNHGWMKCGGTITAPVFIAEDYHFIPVHKNISAFYYHDEDPDAPEENEGQRNEEGYMLIPPRLRQLLNNPLTTTFEELQQDIAAGEYLLRPRERDAAYWNAKVARNWKDLKRVPLSFQHREMYLSALDKDARALELLPGIVLKDPSFLMEALDKTIATLKYFPDALLDAQLAIYAVGRNGEALRYLPERLITKELCYLGVHRGASLTADIPERFYETELLCIAITQYDQQIQYLSPEWLSEDLLVAYVKVGRGAFLDKYCQQGNVSKSRVLERVLEDGVAHLDNLFCWHLSATVYEAAQKMYDRAEYRAAWDEVAARYAHKIARVKK
jgi:hypothetical protein